MHLSCMAYDMLQPLIDGTVDGWGARDAIWFGFHWVDTNEGGTYWNDVYQRLLDDGSLTEDNIQKLRILMATAMIMGVENKPWIPV